MDGHHWCCGLLSRTIPLGCGRCACVGREHKSLPVVLTIDLVDGEAYQQCLDATCRRPVEGGGFVAAGRRIGAVPAGSRPTSEEVAEFLSK